MAKKKAVRNKKKVVSGEPVHVQLMGPVALRREVLGCALQAGELMVSYDAYAKVRTQRLKGVQKLRKLLKEIKSIETKLGKSQLPYVAHEAPKKVVVKKAAKKPAAPKQVAAKKPKTEVETLQDELAAIEKKLSGL